jgi:hypothetical protein
MEYQDFTIDIRSAEAGGLEAKVTEAPVAGNPQVSFDLPLERKALQALHDDADRLAAQGGEPEIPRQEVGQRLYESLFQGEVGRLFEECRRSCGRETGMRIRLRFRCDDAEADYLSGLPWEWLWDAGCGGGAFLATDLSTPIVRDILTRRPWEGAAPREVPMVEGPLRILLVDASPSDQHEFNLGQEIARIIQAVQPLMEGGQVQVLRLRENTPEALRDALLEEPIHILHFMGHGGYDPASGFGAVFFEAPDGTSDQVAGVMLADVLKSIPDLRLVVLNACLTARHAGHRGAPVFSGVASAVVERTGMPAVLAHQYLISNKAAVSFSETFYRRIARGDDVEAAVTQLRSRHEPRSPEWSTPVLFLSTRNGKLFSVRPGKAGATVHIAGGNVPDPEPVRLGIRSFDGWGRDMAGRNDAVLDLVESFEGRFIKDPAGWQKSIFPQLRQFLLNHHDPGRPLLLDFAAHASVAFAAGWVLEAKSGLDVRVLQRTSEVGEMLWAPNDGSAEDAPLWLDRPDLDVAPEGVELPDVALSLAVSRPDVVDHVKEFIRNKSLPVGRIIDAVIAPEPGQRSVRGGAHSLRLAQALLPRFQRRYPHEREGSLHLFCAGPNALVFYLGQLARSLGGIVLYEFAFGAEGGFGKYQRSIELPPPAERVKVPAGWERG